ncbi:hypothetical protein Pryu01_02397 [Paraliobacillus ryukyuensis]|uniref:Uncharacterized protein n=1 Tax=Paraliobacillus ryukyuensis TaxID=200904 RepID=A0A366DX00_9BACI|nr:hypothetical protein [Paraliobacillus ryukyuensis]RBO94613.1 hypothetical protein DES48_110100 [Paraliobacillus ryukyuensis]
MNQFTRYQIFLVLSLFQLIGFLGFGYLAYYKFPSSNIAWIVEGLLFLAVILNIVFYFYFKKLFYKQGK